MIRAGGREWTAADYRRDAEDQVEEANDAWRDEIASQRAEDWADLADDRPSPSELEPNDLTDLCSVCEHGHGGHVCRWCIAAGRTAS